MTYSSEVLADSPSAYWHLGETSGTTAADSSGNSHAGTYTGTYTLNAAGIPGGPDGALSVSGAGDVATTFNPSGMSALTVEFWFKTSDSRPDLRTWTFIGNASSGDTSGWRVTWSGGSPGTMEFHVQAGSNVQQAGIYQMSITPGTWYHVVGVYDGAHVYCYVNGVLGTYAQSAQNGTVGAGGTNIAIGYRAATTNQYVTAVIDEVAVYPSALSSTRISAHYSAGSTSSTTHLTATGQYDASGTAGLATIITHLAATGYYDASGVTLLDRSVALRVTGYYDATGAIGTLRLVLHLAATGGTDADGDALLDFDPPAAPIPIPVSPRLLRRVSYSYDFPTLVNGRVTQQDRTLIVNEPYGYEQILIDGVDVTWFRDVPVQIVSWSWGEPLGPKDLVLAFPQISPFEPPGAFDIDWLDEGHRVDVRLVLPDGTVRRTPLFEGFIHKVRPDGTLQQVAEVLGFGWQGDLQQQKPRFYYPGHEIVDTGVRAPSALNDVIGRQYPRVPLVNTPYDTQKKGSLDQSRCDFCLEIIDDAPGYTIIDRTERGRKLWMRTRDVTTVHYTFALGQHGLDTSGLDRQPGANVVYGEYISPQGGRSQNIHYPFYADDDSLEGAIHLPFASDTAVEPYLYDSDGRVTGRNPSYDPTKLRVETFYQGGEGITRQNMLDTSQQIIDDGARGWHLVGELVATTDPEECHRFDIRAGRNVFLKHMYGGGVLLPVQTVDIDRASGAVRIGVDQQARPAPTVAKIIQLQRAAKADPAGSYRRTSKTSQDTHPVFDADTKAGQVRPIVVPARTWVARSFPATDYGEFVELVASISPACEWGMALWDRRPDVNWLASTVGDPTSSSSFVDNPWSYFADDLNARGWINGWGQPGQPGGYSPGAKYKQDRNGNSLPDGPLTGKIVDDESMTYVSADPPKLWVTVWAQSAGTVSILFKSAPVEF